MIRTEEDSTKILIYFFLNEGSFAQSFETENTEKLNSDEVIDCPITFWY